MEMLMKSTDEFDEFKAKKSLNVIKEIRIPV